MNKLVKYASLILLAIFVVIIVVTFYVGNESEYTFYEHKISGRITSIEYSARNLPIIYLDKESFYLDSYSHKLSEYLTPQDSVFKAANSFKLFVYRDRLDNWEVTEWTDSSDEFINYSVEKNKP